MNILNSTTQFDNTEVWSVFHHGESSYSEFDNEHWYVCAATQSGDWKWFYDKKRRLPEQYMRVGHIELRQLSNCM